MMANFVGDNVGLGKVTRGLELLLQLVIKSQIDIDFPVGRTIKGSGCRLGKTACRLDFAGKKHQLRFLIFSPCFLKQLFPGIFSIGKNYGNKVGESILGRIRPSVLACPAYRLLGRPASSPIAVEYQGRIDTKIHAHQSEYKNSDTTTPDLPSRQPSAPLVFYVVAPSPC